MILHLINKFHCLGNFKSIIGIIHTSRVHSKVLLDFQIFISGGKKNTVHVRRSTPDTIGDEE